MRSYFLSCVSALAGATLALGTSTNPANAVSVFIDSVSGTWSNVTGTASGLSGVGTKAISFGDDTGSGQSGYKFDGAAPPTQGPFGVSVPFNLGLFTHINNPIGSGSSITGATLNLTITGHTDTLLPFVMASQFAFTHNETPNGADPCANGGANGVGVNANGCADIVTVLTAPSSQVLNIGGTDYVFAFSNFVIGGLPFTSFASPEDGSNTATLQASFTTAPVPGPMVGAGLPGLVIAFGGFLAWRRRRQRASSNAA